MFTSRCLANDWKSRALQRFFYRVLGTLVVAVSVPAHPPSLREWSLAFPAPYMFTGQRRNSLLPNKSTMAGMSGVSMSEHRDQIFNQVCCSYQAFKT